MSQRNASIDVLHVDDEPALLEVVSTKLERLNPRFEVRSVSSPTDALAHLAETSVDCIVCDYGTDGRAGIEFLEAVRERDPEIPFILYTGKGSEKVASEAISAGATDYLRKDSGTETYELLANRVLNAVESTRSKGRATRYKHIAELVRTIQSALVRATTPAEIDEAVCETLADADPYDFAVIGDYDPTTGKIRPRSATGSETEDIEAHADVADDGTVRVEIDDPIEARAVHVFQNGPDDPAVGAGVGGDVRSVAVVPLVYDETRYGVLHVSADRPGTFGPEECDLLGDLGETIAHAFNRIALQRQYEEQYRELFEDAPVMFVVTCVEDGELYIEDCNRQLAETLGYEPDDLRGRPVADLYTPGSTWKLREGGGTERALAGEFVAEERELVTSDGERIPTVLRASPRRNEDGEIVGVNSLYVDATHRKRFDEVSRDRRQLRQILDLIPDFVFAKDRDGAFLLVNEAMAEALGTTPEEMVGRMDFDFIDDDEARQFREDDLDVLESNSPKHIEEEELTDVDGNSRVLETVKIPFTVTGTDTDAVLCYARDITDLKERERQLREIYRVISDPDRTFEAKVDALLDIGRDALDASYGSLTSVDDEDLHLWVTRSPDDRVTAGETVPRSATVCDGVLRSGETLAVADVPGDRPQLAEGATEPVPDLGAYVGTAVQLDGGVDGTLAFYDTSPREEAFSEWEVTLVDLLGQWVSYELGRERLTEDLAQQNERLEAFAGIVSHDLRNPLNVAEGRLELAREEGDGEHLDAVASAHERMGGLIEDILSLARAPADVTDPEAVALGELADTCWDNVRTFDATLVVGSDATVLADRRRLQRLFENLLRNALEHGGEDVTVTVGDLDDGFFVEDDGPGIEDGAREDIFEMGYSTGEEGSGFGLSIVATVAEAHGWDVAATEGSEGGARFEIRGVETA